MNRIAVIILAGLIALGTMGSVALTASHETPATVAYVAWHEPEPTPVASPLKADPTPVAVPSIPPCEEDEPCWDCTTMGNRICGPAVVEQAPVYVAPAYVAPKPVPAVTVVGTPVVTGKAVTPVKSSPAPVSVPVVKPTLTPASSCPPVLHRDGVNIAPHDAPSGCVYIQ